MKRFLKYIDKKLSINEIHSIAHHLNQSYYAYMLDEQVWDLINKVFPSSFEACLSKLQQKYVGHKIVNTILTHYYPGERLIKYHLVKNFVKNKDEIAIFEMRIQNSRLDVGRINGLSYAYEIKTELDTLAKLEKQVNDYAQVFEYVTVIIHPKHIKKAKEILPTYCGIDIINLDDNNNYFFESERKALNSPDLNPEIQIHTLTSKDLEFILRTKKQKVPLRRQERESLIAKCLSKEEINYYFKEAVKQRYLERWNFLRSSFNKINPIDIQELYIGPIDPKYIYYRRSSMV